ncbi:MAG: M48 family metallopeptidase [Pseudomonadota bacterium]
MMESNRRTISGVLGAAMLIGLAGCAAMVPESGLEADAEKQFGEMKKHVPLVQDPAVIDYVTCVTTAVVGALDGRGADYEWELAIFDQPQVNAFAMAGGKIAVYSGLLNVAANDSQLAAVIGHEIAHVTERHVAERMARAVATNVGTNVVAGVVLPGQNINAARGISTAIGMGAQFGLLLPFNRAQESEADEEGLIFMARAGFDPRESVNLWQNMAASNGRKVPEFLSTHPSSDTRIDKLVSNFPSALLAYNEAKQAGRNPSCNRPASLGQPRRAGDQSQ